MVMADNGELVMKNIYFLLLLSISSISYGEYKELNHYDVFNYQVCNGFWVEEALPHKCSSDVSLIRVMDTDDRIKGKFTPWKTSSEEIHLITKTNDVKKALEILQEIPLLYTIKTSTDNFSGVFYGSNEVFGGSTYVKCLKKENNCLISNGSVSLDLSRDDFFININPSNYEKNRSYQVPIEAIEFAHWSLNNMI